ncbi:GNAT family N-acetyltransferase [Allonocardiopsis opalescens]|uniref:Acetyltransferase (GNAT) family protein n=1 Tax=Allonocardiopsis opalescens TaxID=1144618 RepID=A0A2T0Q2F2_9ACTN|nr:GNAT family N-acetyltransferase [Allonocardiopsis opalescens]PRX97900.1 acetyltransferase (GNAT) family protein [Allonocardiopsis opalescens]
MADIEITRYNADHAKAIADELIDVYTKVYDTPPYIGDPFFSTAAFTDRLTAAFPSAGFETVVGRLDGRIIGYVHGATLPADKLWFTSLADARPKELVAAAEQGNVFWLRELMVLPEVQSQGIGRMLHDTTIDGRTEPWTTLTCMVDNEPAHSAYLRWGYRIMGQIKHAPESPIYDAMALAPRR